MVDCRECVHYEDDDYCMECVHFERDDLQDFFEKETPEDAAQREEKDRLAFEQSCINEWITVKFSQEFREAFYTVKKIAAPIHFKRVYMCVYAAPDGHLVATDNYRLIEFPCTTIPEELKGKCIVMLDGDQVAIHNTSSFPDYKSIFNRFQGLQAVTMDNLVFNRFRSIWGVDAMKVITDGPTFSFRYKFIDSVRQIMAGDILVSYPPDSSKPVLFISDYGRMVICPMSPDIH